MGFWDENADLAAGGGSYVKKEGKAALIKSGATFVISGVTSRESRFKDDDGNTQYEFVLTVTLPEGVKGLEAGEALMTFQKGGANEDGTYSGVESRDRTLARMSKYLDDPSNAPIEATLELVGRSQLVRPAEA